jgi:hypothetical protein
MLQAPRIFINIETRVDISAGQLSPLTEGAHATGAKEHI